MDHFVVIPAVDMKNGKAVRLKQGRADQQTIYDDDPVRAARRWTDAGARRIHIVDLDGAFDGIPGNFKITLSILAQFSKDHEFEIGGGLRTIGTVAELIAAGAARCVIGTKALEDRVFLTALAIRFPGRISVGLDARGGNVVTKGWLTQSDTPAIDMVKTLSDLPLGEIIYTDIETDGMLQGPNLNQLEKMVQASPFPLIASGGVTTLAHIQSCKDLGCYGAIVGKALYDGRLQIADALSAFP